ncbi:MAG TPA: amidase family protein [Caulobacteraceae bacterium]|nr:amidase family protein [Caulobacteraceae bacterium]
MLTKTIDYATSSAGALAAAVARREVSAVELCEEAIRTIEARDGPINAVVVRDFDRALEQARGADARVARGETGPLIGVPMTVKDSHHVAGLPTTWGLEPFKGWTPTWDSTGVARLKAAGAVILGKTNVPPNLGDWQSANPVYGGTNNPHDLGRSPGGSSGGGAAALAAGMVALEFGSDIGGSIRVPAHFCGVYGHKPSFDLVPQTGHAPPGVPDPASGVPLGVIGPLARTAGDLKLALGVLAGPDGEDAKAYRVVLPRPRKRGFKGLRVLVLDEHPVARTAHEVKGAVGKLADAMANGGAEVIDAKAGPKLPDLERSHRIYQGMLGAIMSLGSPEPATLSAVDWFGLFAGQDAIRRHWARVFDQIDVVVAPTFGLAAFPHTSEPDWSKRSHLIDGEETPYGAQLAWPGLASFTNLPATCVPVTRTAAGLPIGVQIIGPYLEDLTALAVAAAVEEALS